MGDGSMDVWKRPYKTTITSSELAGVPFQTAGFLSEPGILPLLLPRCNTTALYVEKNVRNGRWGELYVIFVDNLFPFGLMGDFDWVEEKKRVMPRYRKVTSG